MASDQSLSLDQRLSMRLSAQQLRFVKLLEFNAPELEEAIDRELEDNPALEALEPAPVNDADIPAYRLNARNYSPDDFSDYDFTPADTSESLYDHLRRQLSERNLSPKLKEAVDYMIDSLDPNGYLLRLLTSLVNDMAFGPGIELSSAEAVEALNILQNLEPYGVGATDLRECLMLQLQHLPESQTRDDALNILENQFEAFSMKHSHKIVSALKISQDRVKEAVNLILTLNPKPGASFDSSNSTNVIVPDLVVMNEDGQLSVALNNRIPELAIDRTFSEAVAEMQSESKKEKKKGSEFVMTRYNDARDFIKVLRQRQETLLNVMTAILKIQKDYFLTEDVYRLKPMMIKDIAALTGYDLSVISRATANKYVATPWGIFPLRFFFSDSIGETSDENNGEPAPEVLTNRKIEAEIEDLVNKEDKKHPLSDEKIKQLMEERGYEVSRRTVAKYRDRKGIPVARLRREM